MNIDKEKFLDGIALELAHEDMGIYCAAVTDSKGVTTERTEYGNGWNAYATELGDKWCIISNVIAKLDDKVQELLVEEKLRVMVREKEVFFYILCNDLFFWGCSDQEEFKLEDLPKLLEDLERSPDYGELLWVCKQRKMRPQQPYYKYFNDDEKQLFNACGKVREL